MKAISQPTIGGFTVPVLVYESYTEADNAAGRPNAALDECNKNLVYRGTLPDARSLVCEIVERVTGVKREYDPVMGVQKGEDGVERSVQKKNRDGEEMWVPKLKDGDYVELALQKSGKTVKDIQPEVDAAASTFQYTKPDGTVFATGLQVDIKERERKAPGPKVLAKKYTEMAEKFLKGELNLGKFTTAFKKTVGVDLTDDDKKDATSLGWKIKDYYAELEKRSASQFAA